VFKFQKKSLLIFLILFSLFVKSEAFGDDAFEIHECPLNRQDKRKGEIAISAIFRDDAAFLKEWIEFHRLIGVSHFYLYNNCSQDNFWEGVLKDYVTKGIVELFDVPFDSYACNDHAKTHNAVQVHCYNHALRLASGYNAWVAIIDSDEFICMPKEGNLKKFLKKYSNAAGLVVYWQIYGTSNIWDLEEGKLLIESLLYKEPNCGGNGMFKSIVNPKLATCIDPHCCTYSAGAFAVNQNNQRFSHTPNFNVLPVDLIRINHYTYRTLSFYYNVKKPRKDSWGFNPDAEFEKYLLDTANSVYDSAMMPFVENLKKALKK